MFRLLRIVVRAISGEWMLSRASNGGAVVIARALSTTVFMHSVASWVEHDWLLSASAPVAVHLVSLVDQAIHSLVDVKQFGTIFAASYAVLYARFASQWTYIANLHNRILETEARTAKDAALDDYKDAIAKWKASFLDDVQELHLATKPIFARVVQQWSTDPEVVRRYVARDGATSHERIVRYKQLSGLVANIRKRRYPDSTLSEIPLDPPAAVHRRADSAGNGMTGKSTTIYESRTGKGDE